jgi:hypothetical protein
MYRHPEGPSQRRKVFHRCSGGNADEKSDHVTRSFEFRFWNLFVAYRSRTS